jgi:hypothetical protein
MGSRSQSTLAIAASTVGARHLKSLSNFQGPSLKHHPPPTSLHAPQTSIIIASRSLSASWICSHSLLVVLYPPDSVSSTVCAQVFNFFPSAPFVDLRAHRPCTTPTPGHCTSAPTHSRDLEITSFTTSTTLSQVDAKQLDIELALIVNPTYKIQSFS